MSLSEKIASSESKFMRGLEEFFNATFDPSFLPSHGLTHHRRVWFNSKEIMNDIAGLYPEIGDLFTDKLIIASFMHDTGMSVDSGFRHGIESRQICERFLKAMKLSITEYADVLNAVENHDNKEYTTINKPCDLLTVLSVADDLDAFGFIGIYRYLEIYLERNVPPAEIGYRIIENSEARFQHFLSTYGSSHELVGKHSKRYEILSSFFNFYNEQLPFCNFDDPVPSGYCGIAEILRRKLYPDKAGTGFNDKIINYPDPVIQWFFTEIKNELASFK